MTFFDKNEQMRRAARWLQPLLQLMRLVIRRWNPNLKAVKYVGQAGPYRFNSLFFFSNFSSWGDRHNSGFKSLIAAAEGKSCVFDVGAHIGLTAMPLADAVDLSSTVVAFEPGAVNFSLLSEHIQINNKRNVVCEHILVGDTEIGSGIPYYESVSASGMNSLFPVVDRQYRVCSDIPMTTLDRYCREKNLAPDLLKIDVEGAEMLVLRGSKELLRNNRPMIFVSTHPRQLAVQNLSADDVKTFLIGFGYAWYLPDGTALGAAQLKFGEYVARYAGSGAEESPQ